MRSSFARTLVRARLSLARSLCALGVATTLAASTARAQSAALERAAHRPPREHWVASWSAAPMADGSTLSASSRGFDDQTLRQVVQLSAGGSRVPALAQLARTR